MNDGGTEPLFTYNHKTNSSEKTRKWKSQEKVKKNKKCNAMQFTLATMEVLVEDGVGKEGGLRSLRP